MSWYTKMQARCATETTTLDVQGDFESYLDNLPNPISVYRNGGLTAINVAIQEDSIAAEKEDEVKLMLSKVTDVFNIGDIITWNNVDWIVFWKDIKTVANNNKVKIMKCNNVIKFYDLNHTLYSKSCVMHTANLRQTESKYITLPSGTFYIICRDYSDTRNIDYNTRFILNGGAYKIIDIDNVTNNGILEIKVEKDMISVNDNMDLSIADYYSNQITKSITIKNSNTATMLYTNSTLQLIVECRNNGVVVSNPVVSYSSSNTYVATVNVNGLITAIGTGNCVVTVNYGGSVDSITINSVMSISDDYNIVISPVDTTIKTGRSITLTAHTMNNGIEDNLKHFNWSLVNSDGSNNVYATITPNDKTCILTAKSFTNKYIIIRASLTNDPLIYVDREIKIVNLF